MTSSHIDSLAGLSILNVPFSLQLLYEEHRIVLISRITLKATVGGSDILFDKFSIEEISIRAAATAIET
jgi:hypothetical protein